MTTPLQPRLDAFLAQLSSQIPDLLRRVLAVVLLLLLLAASLVVAGGLARLSPAHGVRADGGEIPPICPKPCASITAMRADGPGLPPLPPVGGTLAHLGGMPVLAQSRMAVLD